MPTVEGSNGGKFTIDEDGSLSFDLDGDFAGLGLGVSRATSVDYTITDGHGAFDTATATVTVEGVNDAPTVGQGSPARRSSAARR